MTPGPPFESALDKLPHGPEFRFIDALASLLPGVRATATYLVRGTEPFLAGHFPGDPLFPGVLLVEGVAQLAGVVAQTDPTTPELAGLKLTALRSVKILGTARPGDTIQFHAEVLGRLGLLVQARGGASIDGKEILTADLVLSGSA